MSEPLLEVVEAKKTKKLITEVVETPKTKKEKKLITESAE
jgi:hypothetical protein